ncbi:MAG: response regulator [Thermodesulfobacteriota bacterium]|nr:response regulator [Thermodesulfobacteriota bacterium]
MVKTKQIAIIEDEEAHFALMKRAIVDELPLAVIHHFKEGYSFLEKLDEINPDIIITDYLMPDIDGVELLETLNNRGSKIPVIMVTGQGNEMVAVKAMKLGVWDYLVKSDNFFTLLPRVINRVIRESDLMDSLQKSEERFKNIFENSPIGIGLCALEGRVLEANRALLKIFGVPDAAKIEGVKVFDEASMCDDTRTKLLNGQTIHLETIYDFGVVHKTGLYNTTKTGTIFIDIVITAFGEKERYPLTEWLVQIQDITERKQAQEDIRRLSQQLLEAQETERQMISRELHDKIGQDLSMLKIGCEILLENDIQFSDKTRQNIAEFIEILQKTITATRDLAYDLRPPGLQHFGLVSTLYQYCSDFSEKTGLTVNFNSAGMDNIKLDSGTEINIYRLVQEGLNNIRKHAGAGQAVVRLVASFPNIILRIEDDGRGFDVKERMALATKEKRMGLRSMEERIGLLAGKMEVQSSTGEGTKIFIEIPSKESKNGSKENHIDR